MRGRPAQAEGRRQTVSGLVLDENVRRLLFVDRDRVRGTASGGSGLLHSLVADAVAWRHERTRQRLWPMLAAFVSQGGALRAEIRRAQRGRLLVAAESEGQLAEYLPSLMYFLGDDGGFFEALSSQSMRTSQRSLGVTSSRGPRHGQDPGRRGGRWIDVAQRCQGRRAARFFSGGSWGRAESGYRETGRRDAVPRGRPRRDRGRQLPA